METFDLQEHLNAIYRHFPQADRQPVIGITGNFNDGDATLSKRYYDSVVRAGGTPIIIPPVADRHVLANTLEHIDGLLLSGGADFNPLWSGEEPSPQLHRINEERDLPELLITRLAYDRQIPILGICRGIQTLAVALGGKVAQDIYEARQQQSVVVTKERTKLFGNRNAPQQPQWAPMIKHAQDAGRGELTHSINIDRQSALFDIYNKETIYVNSFHHQAVSEAGQRFHVVATSPDGVTEAIESSEYKPILGVQWHPECLESGLPLFEWLVRQAANFDAAKRLHRRIVTLDTHCDTPMFFSKGVTFDSRDENILVDLQKMSEGRLSAVTMAAYLPQPKIGEQFSQIVPFDVSSPMDYADLIFNKIEEIVKRNSRCLSIARTPSDLYEDKRKGRKSIMFAIENGLALNHDVQNVKHFAQRGVTYITLCHNGDNDICDSAKGCNTHNGVSQFGEKVINAMNEHGILVDLSHAAEKSFYDALNISQTPIVCSHSNCRALCDHPRNLTDQQLRALAKAGGLCHITLYGGFLRQVGEATILDAMNHLEHAIKIMGVEHVGLGTDFDGDGGIIGLANCSELINFTLQLMKRKFNERDIEKIWGGNWLRLMAAVQRKIK